MPTTNLAIALCEHRIHLTVASAAKGGARLTHVEAINLPDPREGEDALTAAEAGAAVRAALRALKATPRRTAIILPKSQVVTRQVRLPSTEAEELGRMAKFEAERHIPFHPERHIVNHHVVHTEGLEGSDVFIAAADEPVVRRALDIAAAADLEVDAITVSAVAGHAALLRAEGEALRDQVVAFIVIGAEATDISVVKGGELLFTRAVTGGVAALLAPTQEGGDPAPRSALTEMHMGTDAPDSGRGAALDQFAQRLMMELQRTYEFSRREYSCPPLEAVLLSGEGSLVEGLAEDLGRRLGLPGRRVDLGRIAAAADEAIGNERLLATHLEGIGAVLTPRPEGAIALNLTPPAYLAERESKRLRKMALVSGGLALLAVILTIVYLRVAVSAVEETEDALRVQSRDLRPFVDEMEDMETQIEIIENMVNEENSALAILNFVSGLPYTPPREYREDDAAVLVAMNSFDYDREMGTLELEGFTRRFEDLTQFRQDLQDTGWFTSVEIDRRNPETLQGRGQVIHYVIKCELEQTARPERGRRRAPSRRSSGRRFGGGGQ